MILFLTGADGTTYYSGDDPGTTESGAAMERLRSLGFVIVQLRWDQPGWQSARVGRANGPVTQACLPATVIAYVHDTYYVPLGVTGPEGECGFCVTGNSSGASVAGYALARFGLDSIIDRAVLSSGPTHASLTRGCYGIPGYKYAFSNRRHIDLTYGFAADVTAGPCHRRDPAFAEAFERDSLVSSSVEGDFSHPGPVTMVLGALDSSRWHNMARLYEDELVAGGTVVNFVVVPGAGHNLKETAVGMDVIESELLGLGTEGVASDG